MKWMRYRVRTNTASEDIIISAMADLGLYGAQIEDKVPLTGRELEELFVDEAPLQAIADDDGSADLACLNFYVEIDQTERTDSGAIRLRLEGEEEGTVDPDVLKRRMQEALEELRVFSDIGDGAITLSVTEDIDWRDNWKQYFHKFFIDDLLILPSWEAMEDAEAERANYVLHIDPGAAFGTGLHETTKLAVRALRSAVEERPTKHGGSAGGGEHLLDIGTGSGVLSILGVLFGMDAAVGVDVDRLAVTAARENRERNGLTEEQMRLFQGDLITDSDFCKTLLEEAPGGYELLVANILPDVLIPLTPVVPSLLKKGGHLIYSGILTDKLPMVEEALSQAGFKILHRSSLGEWSALQAIML